LQEVGFIYSRLTNPTVAALQERVASLEGGAGAVATASGHAAQQLALFPLMNSGCNFVASTRLYGGSITQFGQSFKRFGWDVRFVDTEDRDRVKEAIDGDTRAIWVESLANPGGVVTDLEPLAEIAKGANIPLMVDNTLASPFLCRPFDWGADIAVHSTTKFLSGNGASMGGVVVDAGTFDWAAAGKFPSLSEPEPAYHGLVFQDTFGPLGYTLHGHAIGLRDLGACQAPMNAFITLLGIETLSLRMARHCENALAVATFLESHPGVSFVSYAGLKSSPYNALAQKYLPRGAGSVFTFGIKGGYEAGVKLVDNVELFSHLANLGDSRSLIIHSASTTHRQLSDEQRISAGAGPEVVRLSIGLETADDLIRDLDQALTKAT
jgi:O-acetylhomoserine (thiol)-lyase